jgi:hypothetical protein
MEINQPMDVELKISKWCKLARVVKNGTRMSCVSLRHLLLPPITWRVCQPFSQHRSQRLPGEKFLSCERDSVLRSAMNWFNDQGHLFTALGRGHSSVGLVDKVHSGPCHMDCTVGHILHHWGLSNLSKPNTYLTLASYIQRRLIRWKLKFTMIVHMGSRGITPLLF